MLEKQWIAIYQCDGSFDGKFFYAVKTTGIVCKPSCKSRVPNRDNVLIFETVNAALEVGFRACKRCRPDQFNDPSQEFAYETMKFIETHFCEPLTLIDIARQLHINQYHLHHKFKQIVGVTPVDYLLKKRILEAKRLLTESNLTITEIAVTVGFMNASHFSTVFCKHLGMPPSTYRKVIKANEKTTIN